MSYRHELVALDPPAAPTDEAPVPFWWGCARHKCDAGAVFMGTFLVSLARGRTGQRDTKLCARHAELWGHLNNAKLPKALMTQLAASRWRTAWVTYAKATVQAKRAGAEGGVRA